MDPEDAEDGSKTDKSPEVAKTTSVGMSFFTAGLAKALAIAPVGTTEKK